MSYRRSRGRHRGRRRRGGSRRLKSYRVSRGGYQVMIYYFDEPNGLVDRLDLLTYLYFVRLSARDEGFWPCPHIIKLIKDLENG